MALEMEEGFYEIRVCGKEQYYYGIEVFKNEVSKKNKIMQEFNPSLGVNVVTMTVEGGKYFLSIQVINQEANNGVQVHDFELFVLAYSNQIFKTFEDSVLKTKKNRFRVLDSSSSSE